MKTLIIAGTIVTLLGVSANAEAVSSSIKPDASVEYAFKTQKWSGDVGITTGFSGLSIRPSLDWSYTSANSIAVDGAKVTSTLPLDSNLSVYSELSLSNELKYDSVSIGLSYTFEQENNMDWIKGRLKEPSSYAAAAVAGLGLGIIFTLPILSWAGIVCAIFALVMKEDSCDCNGKKKKKK